MDNLKTIAVSDELHEQIASYGTKKETYNQILERLIADAQEVQVSKLLLNTEGTTDVHEIEW